MSHSQHVRVEIGGNNVDRAAPSCDLGDVVGDHFILVLFATKLARLLRQDVHGMNGKRDPALDLRNHHLIAWHY